MLQNTRPHLVYVADPMCSWCYAFKPELDKIAATTELPVRLVMGGLFTGPRALPLDDNLRAYLDDTWARVAEISGQPISLDLLSRDGWTYDTELACRALIAVRQLDESKALAFFQLLQRSFYAAGCDLTDPAATAALAVHVGIGAERLGERLTSRSVIAETSSDFAEAAELGAEGFPTLLLDTGTEQITVSAGYNRAGAVLRTIAVFS